ncbi:MAG: hypothetical protein PHE19_07385, partial [Candidatus Cloacimonetes bacterium]|nr:hypothetical protein [Candidatus Cloacimonadota bacterium]
TQSPNFINLVLNDLKIHFSNVLVYGTKLIHFLKRGYAKGKNDNIPDNKETFKDYFIRVSLISSPVQNPILLSLFCLKTR